MKYLKNLVFNKILTGIFILSMAGTVMVSDAQDTPAFDELKSFFEDGYVFKAEFNHIYIDNFTGSEQTTEGQIWIGEGQYKIEGDSQQMIVDGEISRVYDRVKNRVIISEYIEEEDDFAPSRMLQGVDETFSVSENELEDGKTEIKMISDDPFSIFMEVTIILDQNRNPIQIQAFDQVDNELTTTFSSGSFIEEQPGQFDISVPDSAEVIDLRHES